MVKLFYSQTSIQPRIGHLKLDHLPGRNFHKGLLSIAINVVLAAAVYNCKRAVKTLLRIIKTLLERELRAAFYF